jgi:hypothetical protein
MPGDAAGLAEQLADAPMKHTQALLLTWAGAVSRSPGDTRRRRG